MKQNLRYGFFRFVWDWDTICHYLSKSKLYREVNLKLSLKILQEQKRELITQVFPFFEGTD